MTEIRDKHTLINNQLWKAVHILGIVYSGRGSNIIFYSNFSSIAVIQN